MRLNVSLKRVALAPKDTCENPQKFRTSIARLTHDKILSVRFKILGHRVPVRSRRIGRTRTQYVLNLAGVLHRLGVQHYRVELILHISNGQAVRLRTTQTYNANCIKFDNGTAQNPVSSG